MFLAIMEGYSLLCFKYLMVHVVCNSIEFSRDVSIGYRAFQMLL